MGGSGEKALKHFIAKLIAWGPFGLLLLAVLDSAGVPVVGGVDALLIAVAASNPGQAYLSAGLAVIGSVAGSLLLFSIARKGGEVLLARHVASGTGANLYRWFQRWGLATVFVPALSPLPLPMKIPVFCAGALQVRRLDFTLVILAARTIRYFTLAYLGIHYGEQTLLYAKAHPWQIGLGALVLAALVTLSMQVIRSGSNVAAEGRPE